MAQGAKSRQLRGVSQVDIDTNKGWISTQETAKYIHTNG